MLRSSQSKRRRQFWSWILPQPLVLCTIRTKPGLVVANSIKMCSGSGTRHFQSLVILNERALRRMKACTIVVLAVSFAVTFYGQTTSERAAAALPTDQLLSEPGPTFRVDESASNNPLTVIAFGDQRFTNPAN